MADIENVLRDVQAELKRVGDDVQKTAENALKETKANGELTRETKDAADKLLIAQNALSDRAENLEKKLEGVEEQNLAIEQRLSNHSPNGAQSMQTMGQAVAISEDVKAFAANGSKGTVKIDVSNAITSVPASAGSLIFSERETDIVALPRQQFAIRDLLTQGRTSSNLVEYLKMTSRTLNAAMVAETAEKPESDLVYEKADAPVRTLAHWIAVSRQAMDDAAQLQTEIDSELRYGLDLVEDAQLLQGDGTGENLSGLITNATAYSGSREANISSPTLIDKLRVALLEASLALYPADGIVLHEADWTYIETTKDADNRYIFANPLSMAGPTLWGRRVVPTLSMTEDKFLVGAFRTAATVYDRMETEVLISSEDRDNFVKNMLTVRAERRLALAVKRPEALIYGDFGLVA